MDHVASATLVLERTHGRLKRSAHGVVPVIAAAGIGFVWGAETPWIALSPVVFVAWWWSPSRWHAFAVGFAYHLVAARTLISGAERYFEVSMLCGAACVALGSALVAAVWAVWWSARGRTEHAALAAARMLGLWLSTYLPGIGAIAVGTPLCAAGVWMPGTGWLGLMALFAVSVGARRLAGASVLTVLSVVGAASWVGPGSAPIGTVQTQLAPAEDALDFETQWHVATASINAAERSRARIVVLPEGAAGLWHRPMQRVWEPFQAALAAEGRHAIVGAAVERADGRFDNVAVVLGPGEGPVYMQRTPIPLAMWTPWSSDGFAAHWLGRGTVDVGGRRLGVAICWEAALAWPLLQSVAEGADVLVVLANTAWLPAPALKSLRQGLEGWGALFGLPVAIAANVNP